jgi:hypothetical protein
MWVRIIAALLAAAMLALSVITGESVDAQGLRWLGGCVSAITLLLLAFDRWIYRWPGVRWLTQASGTPVIHGTWRGILHFEKDAQGNAGDQPIYMAVHQTYCNVKIRCYFPTKGSQSESLLAAIFSDRHRPTLRYIYCSQVPAPYRDTNRPTEGTVELHLVGRPINEISGSYYAERNGARGTIAFDSHATVVAGSGMHAEGLVFRSLRVHPDGQASGTGLVLTDPGTTRHAATASEGSG